MHIVEQFHRGSVERWLLRLWQHAQASGRAFDWTFYCTIPEPGELEKQAVADGARIIRSPVALKSKTAFLAALRGHVRAGKYDIVHSQHDLLSAFYWVGISGLPCRRITHVHNTDEIIPTSSRWKRALLLGPMRIACLVGSERVLATSFHALDQFLAGRKRDPVKHRVHYCSLDVESYLHLKPEREAVRRELKLPIQSEILFFAGRLTDIKNPGFVIGVLQQVLGSRPNAVAVFAGDGPEADNIRRDAASRGIADRVRVLGWRDDVPRLMRAADLFVNPRREEPREGFGLVVLEAQAAGLRILISDGISTEPVLEGSIWRQLPLAAGAGAWADTANELLQIPRLGDNAVREMFSCSLFDLGRAVSDLHAIYDAEP